MGSEGENAYSSTVSLTAVAAARAARAKESDTTAEEATADLLLLVVAGVDVGVVTTTAATTTAGALNDLGGSSQGGDGHGESGEDGGVLHVDGLKRGVVWFVRKGGVGSLV